MLTHSLELVFQTVNYVQYYWEDNENTPFVTSFSFIPIREVPFPALSVRSIQATSAPPWLNMVSTVLDNVEYDCLNEDNDCLNRTLTVRQHFGNLIERAVGYNFQKLQKIYRYNNNELTRKDFSKICVLLMRLLGKSAYGVIHSIVQLLEASHDIVDLNSLAVEIFRIPRSLALIKVKEFLLSYERNLTESSITEATSALVNSSQKTQGTMFAFIASQGNLKPKVTLGAFVYFASVIAFVQPGMDLADPVALDIKKVLEDLLLKKTTVSEVVTVVSGGNNKISLKYVSNCYPRLNIDFSQCTLYTNQTDLMCCKMFNDTLSHYEVFLGVMKYDMRPTTWELEDKGYVTDIEEATEMLPYQESKNPKIIQGLYAEIFQSRYFGNRLNNDSSTACHFAKTYSKGGIINTFNAPYYWSIYKENYFTKAYFNQIYSKTANCDNFLKAGPLHAASHGQNYAFEAVIPVSETGEVIEVHSPFDLPNLNLRPIFISAGKTYTITVTPSVTKIDTKLDKDDMAKLGCFSNQDHNLTFFKDYGQSKCLFECYLRLAIQRCNCIPWNYPHIDAKSPVCLESKNNCFNNVLLHAAEEDHNTCNCPPACNRIQYTYHVDTAQTDYYRVCKSHWEKMGLHKRNWIRNTALRVRDIKSVQDFLDEEFPPDPCHTLMPKMAFVQVYMAPPDVSVALTSLRATLPEHVATFGGVLGLFTGMSLLSLFEIVIWILRIVVNGLYKR